MKALIVIALTVILLGLGLISYQVYNITEYVLENRRLINEHEREFVNCNASRSMIVDIVLENRRILEFHASGIKMIEEVSRSLREELEKR